MGLGVTGIGIDLQVKLVDNFRRRSVLAILEPDNLVESGRYDLLVEIKNYEGGENLIFRRLKREELLDNIHRWKGFFPEADVYVSQNRLANYLVRRHIRQWR